MLGRYLSSELDVRPTEAIAAIEKTANDPKRIDSSIHNFYKYPACFPPNLIRQIIGTFTDPGDTVLDPFMGGGTSAVEGLLMNRNVVGVDLNDLSLFSTRLKTLRLARGDVKHLDRWINRVAVIPIKLYDDMTPVEEKIFRDVPEAIVGVMKRIRAAIDAIENQRAQMFARGVLLSTARTLLDNRREYPSPEGFLERVQLNYEEMLTASLQFAHAIGSRSQACSLKLIKGDSSSAQVLERLKNVDGKIGIVVTSPPYPGISILYNRWQLNGRRETNLPYWIIGSKQDEPASYFTMGHPKTNMGEEQYFRTIQSSFGNIRGALARGTLVVQVVAFSERKRQLLPYLDAMDSAGFSEIRNLTRKSYDGRLWREVTNRKWYNNLQDEGPSRKEVIFFHRAR